MFATRVSRLSDKLTYSEKKIARLILENSDHIDSMTSDQIAHQVGCAQATVSRFSQKLGYPSFKSMIMDITTSSLLHKSAEVRNSESLRDTMFKLKNLYAASLDDAMENNTDEMIDEAVSLMERANRMLFYGVRGSFSTVTLLYYRLLEIGLPVLKADSVLDGMNIVCNFGSDDVAFLVSASGEAAETVTIARAASAAGAKIISVTGNPGNTIEALSDIALKSADFNAHTNRINLVNRVPALFLLDTLFMRLWQRNEEAYTAQTEEFQKKMGLLTINAVGEPDAYRF